MELNYIDFDGEMGIYTKGHVSLVEFYEQIKHEVEEEYLPSHPHIKHHYARCVPDSTGTYAFMYYFYESYNGPGSFPITSLLPG